MATDRRVVVPPATTRCLAGRSSPLVQRVSSVPEKTCRAPGVIGTGSQSPSGS
jgi:hypothetical protein